jgi:hypothetical protein
MTHALTCSPRPVRMTSLSMWLVFGLLLAGCQRMADAGQNGDSELRKSKNHAEVPIPHVIMHGGDAMDWVSVKNAGLQFTSKGGPVLVGLLPQAQPLNTVPAVSGLSFQIPTFGNVNRWLISIVRDGSFEVAVFDVGQSSHNDLPGLHLPTTLLNLDIAPAGAHSYTLRVKYIGSPKNGPKNLPGEMQITNAQLIVVDL